MDEVLSIDGIYLPSKLGARQQFRYQYARITLFSVVVDLIWVELQMWSVAIN